VAEALRSHQAAEPSDAAPARAVRD
jgi:hypothetical protein